MPLILSPIGLTGMYARRGEVQVAKAAAKSHPFYSIYSFCLFSRGSYSSDRSTHLVSALYTQRSRFYEEYA